MKREENKSKIFNSWS